MPAKKKTEKKTQKKTQEKTQKKTKKRQPAKSKRTAGSKTTAMKKSANAKKKPAGKRRTSKKGLTKKKSKKQVRRKSQTVNTVAFPREGRGARSGKQSGDLQGLSSLEGPDSESVDELLEEGNAFEADVVKGVEDAGDSDEKEVHTHEVPEDDVPEEYLDKD